MARNEESMEIDPLLNPAFYPQGEGAALALVRITEPQNPRTRGALRDHLAQPISQTGKICPKSYKPFSGRAGIST